MPRLDRKYRLGYANHLIGRTTGNQVAFVDASDGEHFLGLLKSALDRAECELFNYTLIPNHYHCENSRPKNPEALSGAMKTMLKDYTEYHHDVHGSRDSLWRPRFKSFAINTDAYLLTCGIYIDLNAVRAGLTTDPADYEWSSAGFYLRGDANAIITPNPAYLELGRTDAERQRRYRELCDMWLARGVSGKDAKAYFKRQPKHLLPGERKLTYDEFVKKRR